MEKAICWHCGDSIYPNDNEDWVDSRGTTYCPGQQDDVHVPRTRDIILDDLYKRMGWERKNKKESSTSYCAGCHSSFPSSQGYPHTQSGDTLIYCPRCSDNGEILGEENGFSVSARVYKAAPSIDLECDQCGEELDPGDDDETDFFGGVGETCPNCNKGKLKIAKSPGMTTQDTYEDASMLQANDQSALTPDVAEDLHTIINAPRSFRPPRNMTREQVNGLDSNGDGIYPRSHKHASYESLKNHLINHHGFRNNWLQGYNEKDLLKVYDEAHKHGAYACDHDHPVADYEHGTMVSSHKIEW